MITLLFLFIETVPSANATITRSEIISIEPSESSDWTPVFLADGRVLRVSRSDPRLIDLHHRIGEPLEIEFKATNSIDHIVDIRTGESDQTVGYLEPMRFAHDLPPEAKGATGMLSSFLFGFFREMGLRSSAQCFHRAYLWAYETFKTYGLVSEKVFLFFTRRYIREQRFRWWFHVAPLIRDNEKDFIIDPTYVSEPRELNQWTSYFIRNGETCPFIEKYEGRGHHNQTGSCYMRKTSMFHYHPNDLRAADQSGKPVSSWNKRWLAFSRRARQP